MNGAGDKKTIIFLANDSYNELMLIQSILSDCGYFDIETFSNGNELLLFLDRRRPDVIISDIQMPQVDGFQLLREIKSSDDQAVRNIPVIMCSATFNAFETRKLALESGAAAFLTLPADKASLVETIERVTPKPVPNESANAAGQLSQSPDSRQYKVLILEDDKYNARFLVYALKDLKYSINSVESVAGFNAVFDEFKPDVCLLDYTLPDGNGLDVMKSIKSKKPEVKVILMTAITNERMIDEFIMEGADNFLNKPINVRSLITAVKNAAECR